MPVVSPVTTERMTAGKTARFGKAASGENESPARVFQAAFTKVFQLIGESYGYEVF